MNYNRAKQRFMAIPIAGMIFFLCSAASYADWQIDVSRFIDDICRTQYDSRLCNSPSRIGNFATKQECENARYQYCGGRGDAFCMKRIYCTGYDSNTPSQSSGDHTESIASKQGNEIFLYTLHTQEVIERNNKFIENYKKQEREKELQKQRDFENDKKVLLSKLKSGKDLKESISGFKNENKKEEYINAIKKLSCTAEYSLEASNAALAGDFERARESAGCIFDYFGAYFAPAIKLSKLSKCSHACNVSQTVKIYIPDVPPPVEANPQAKVYNDIRERSNKLLPEVIYNQNRLKETEDRIKKLEEQRSKIKEQKEIVEKQQAKVNVSELREQLGKEKTIFDQDDASLMIEAERLNKEALEMQKS